MSVKISENEPYIITLDSLDLPFLHTNITNMTGVTPIWSSTQKNYYEFHVVTDSESDTDDETDLNDVMKCQTCHICNVEVPVIFLDEHHNSEKHQSFKKLTQSVLERAAKNLDTSLSVTKKNITNDIYYCVTCSVAVLKENKWIHNKTKQHLSSQKYDENMSSLITLYVNKDGGDMNSKKNYAITNNEEKNIMKNDDDKIIMKNSYDKMMMKNGNGNISMKDGIGKILMKNDDKIILKDDQDNIILKNDHDKIVMKNDDDKNILNNAANSSVGTSKITEIFEGGEAYVKIKPQDFDGFIKIPRNDYHGLQSVLGVVYCQLCTYRPEESIDTHIKSYKHLSIIQKPINKDGMREVDSYFYHCVVCNDRVALENYKIHTDQNYCHKLCLTKYTENETIQSETPQKTYCEPCDRYILTHFIPAHNNGKTRKAKTATPIITTNETIQSETLQKTYCEPCDRYMLTRDIPAHNNSKKHIAKIATPNSGTPTNNIAKIPNENLKKKLSIYHITNTSNPKELKCELCKVILPNTDRNVNEHINAKKHKDNVLKHAKLNDTPSDDSDDSDDEESVSEDPVVCRFDYCDVCKVKLPGGETGKIIHEKGKKHEANLVKK